MNCPRCQEPLTHDTVRCEGCGFDLDCVCQTLGAQWVRLERLTDSAHCLRLRDHRRLDAMLDDFGRQFPQVFLAVYFGVLPVGLTVSEAGFWLLNHAAFSTHDVAKRNDFGLVIVVDPAQGAAGISLGYCLEQVLGEGFLEMTLAKASAHFSRSEHGAALEMIIPRLAAKLRAAGRPQPAGTPPWSPGHGAVDMGLAPLRQPYPHKPVREERGEASA
jgi:hypothetical protein